MNPLKLTLCLLSCAAIGGQSLPPAFAQQTLNVSDSRQVPVRLNADAYVARQKISLAPTKFFVIEFPPDDDTLFVTLQDENALKMDDAIKSAKNSKLPIVIRAAADWNTKSESTTVMIQMASGAVLMLDVSPAPTARTSIDRVVWQYSLEAARRARQFSLSLVDSAPNAEQNAVSSNERVADSAMSGATSADFRETFPPEKNILAASNRNISVNLAADPERSPTKSASEVVKAEKAAANALNDVSAISFGFRKPSGKGHHDFDIAALPSRWINNGVWTLSVIAVRNKSKNSLQLVSLPSLQIEMTGKKRQSLNNEPLAALAVKTSATQLPLILQPNEVVYFSFVYPTPVLSTNQQLLVLVAQTNAADSPAYLPLRPGASF